MGFSQRALKLKKKLTNANVQLVVWSHGEVARGVAPLGREVIHQDRAGGRVGGLLVSGKAEF